MNKSETCLSCGHPPHEDKQGACNAPIPSHEGGFIGCSCHADITYPGGSFDNAMLLDPGPDDDEN